MPWSTDAEVKTALATRIGHDSSATLPARYNDVITHANDLAYHKLREILIAYRGYTAAQLNTWAGRKQYNIRGALCLAFTELSLTEERLQLQSLDRICSIWEELMTMPLVDEDGEVIVPAGLGGSPSWGKFDDDDDDTTIEMTTTL